jgi:hypothetical protein
MNSLNFSTFLPYFVPYSSLQTIGIFAYGFQLYRAIAQPVQEGAKMVRKMPKDRHGIVAR